MAANLMRRMFVPIVILLSLLALYIYLFYDNHSRPKDIREAVPVERFTLSNGLTVIVMPNPDVAAVTHMLVVKAGSADDPYGKTGVAHYLEHLMFTGSKNYAEGTYDKAIARLGGTFNAHTGRDYTVYETTVAREHLPTVMAMESDRMQFLNFDPIKAKRELQVVSEERSMRVDNNAGAQLSEQLTALTFLNHPYHHPTIGWAEDIATLTEADARAFYSNYYRASNMLLVVAGDITASEVRRQAQRYYSALNTGSNDPRAWPGEPQLRLERKAILQDAKVQQPRLLRFYVAPSVVEGASVQAIPLSLLAQYLGGGETSLLYRTLVREQKLAVAVDVDYNGLTRGPELFRISAVPAPGVSLEQLEAGIDRVLARVVQETPDDDALTRAKTQFKASFIFAQDGIDALATVITTLYAIGLDEQYFYEWPQAVERVTGADMRGAAAALFIPSKRVTGYLQPNPVATPVATATSSTAAVAPAPDTAPAPTRPVVEAPHAQ